MADLQQVTVDSLIAWVREFADLIEKHSAELNALDAAIGDADHGSNLNRGCQAVLGELEKEDPADIEAFGRAVGMQLISTVGGASGVLYGSLFLAIGSAAGPVTTLDARAFSTAWAAGVQSVIARGKASLGDKTMIDALVPATLALEKAVSAGATLHDALALAGEAAEGGVRATEQMIARKGRASYLGERSAGHIDSGASSSCQLVLAAANTLAV